MYYTQILLCVVGFFQHYLFRYGVYGKTFECDFGEKIENEYFIYLINFFYFLIEKVSRPCFMSMIITSVFPSPFFHRDLTFGFIFGHRLGHRQNHESGFMTQNSYMVNMVKQRLIGKPRTRTLADFGHACPSISGRHLSTDTLNRGHGHTGEQTLLNSGFGPLSEPSTRSWGDTVRPTFLYASRKNNGVLHLPQCMGYGIDYNQL